MRRSGSLLARLPRALLMLGVAGLPLYFGASGGMQIAHVLIAVFAFWYVSSNGICLRGVDGLILTLAAYVFFRELFDFAHVKFDASLMPAAYLVFAFLVVNTFRRAGDDLRFAPSIASGAFVAALVAVSGVLLMGFSLSAHSDSGRSIGTFNNPNQLGYFAVCILAMGFLLRLRAMIKLPTALMIVAVGFLLALASLSKAAILGALVACVLLAYISMPRKFSWLLGSFCVVIAVCLLLWVYQLGYLNDLAFVQRLQSIGEDRDDSLEARGYSLLRGESVWKIVFGLGSSGVFAVSGHEVHSTVFSFFVTYGLIGGFLFSSIMLAWLYRLFMNFGFIGVGAVWAPVMLYGITHNGSRFAIFWVLVAMSMVPKSARVDGFRSGMT